MTATRERLAAPPAPDGAPRAPAAAGAPSLDQLHALHEAVLAVNAWTDDDPEAVAPLVTRIVARAVDVLGANAGVIALAEHPAWSSLVPGTTIADGNIMLRHTGEATRRRHRPGGTALRALDGQPSQVRDTRDPVHDGAYEWLAEAGIGSFTVVPLRPGSGDVLGALIINFSQPGALADTGTRLLELFAAHAAVALERAQRVHTLRWRAAQAAQMAQILAQVAAAESVEVVLVQLLRGATALLGGRTGWAQLVDPETGERVLALDLLESGETRSDTSPAPLAPGTIGAAIAGGGGARLVEDAASLPPGSALRAAMLAAGRRSSVNVPIDAAGKRIGSLHVEHAQRSFFTPADLALAEALAALAGAAVERARLETERAEKARLDAALLVARTVAHEINNGLAPITGYAELLSLCPPVAADPTAVSYARRILWASINIAGKVKRLQRIIRLEETESPAGVDRPLLDLDRSTAAD